jgi:Transglutaminase-like superfamily
MGWAIRAEAYAIAALVRVLLRLLPLPRVAALLARIPRTRSVSTPRDCVSAAAEAARRAAHPTCLFTALTTFALLARRGHRPHLVIGAAHGAGLDAHAWVNLAGVPVVANARDYATLWTYATKAVEIR